MTLEQKKKLKKCVIRMFCEREWNATGDTELSDFINEMLTEKDKEIERLNEIITALRNVNKQD